MQWTLDLVCIHPMQIVYLIYTWLLLNQASSKQNLVRKGVWVNIIRGIWDQRNLIVFKQGVVDAEEILQRAQLKSWLWMKHKVHSFNYSFVDWILNPLICINSYK